MASLETPCMPSVARRGARRLPLPSCPPPEAPHTCDPEATKGARDLSVDRPPRPSWSRPSWGPEGPISGFAQTLTSDGQTGTERWRERFLDSWDSTADRMGGVRTLRKTWGNPSCYLRGSMLEADLKGKNRRKIDINPEVQLDLLRIL